MFRFINLIKKKRREDSIDRIKELLLFNSEKKEAEKIKFRKKLKKIKKIRKAFFSAIPLLIYFPTLVTGLILKNESLISALLLATGILVYISWIEYFSKFRPENTGFQLIKPIFYSLALFIILL